MSETIKGEVEAIHENGIKIDGGWFNYPPKKKLERAQVGDVVELEVGGTKKKWINSIKFLNRTKKEANMAKKGELSDKDVRTTRLSLISSAAEMLKTHGRSITAEEVEDTARKWERYVYESKKEEPKEQPKEDEDIPF